MEPLPEFWRTEIWHPLSVHFPIALLIIAFLLKLTACFIRKELWSHSGSILLFAGTIAAWLAIYTGNMADGIVSRQICDPTVLKDHENAAYTVAWLFSAASLFDVGYLLGIRFVKTSYLRVVVILLMATGSGFLAYTGHLGATLVYQQAAGVHVPSENCDEFNE